VSTPKSAKIVSSFPSYFGRILEEGCTDNGVFGVKMMWHYLDGLLPQLASTCSLQGAQPAEILAAAFPNLRYLWLRRGDKVRQAISLYRALETRIWRSTDGGKGEDREPTFNLVAIDQLVQLTLAEDHAWQAYFQQYSLQPWVVTYEDLAASSEDVIVAILDHLGLPHQARPLRSRWRHQKQADKLTEEWVRRYVAFKGSLPSS